MGVSNPSYFITTKNKKNMENAIIVPFDLNTARKIKSGEIEGSVLIDKVIIYDFTPKNININSVFKIFYLYLQYVFGRTTYNYPR